MIRGPKRGEATWDDFIKRHAKTLYATDFFSKNVWTMRGLVDVYILFFIHVGSRRVYLAGIFAHPDNTWMKQQAKNVCMYWDGLKKEDRPTILLRDFDSKYTKDCDDILKAEGIEVKRISPKKAEPQCVCRAVRSVGKAGMPRSFHLLWRRTFASHYL